MSEEVASYWTSITPLIWDYIITIARAAPDQNIRTRKNSFWREFKEKYAVEFSAKELKERFNSSIKPYIHSTRYDDSTKILLYRALEVPVNDRFLERVRETADVELNHERCIINYKKKEVPQELNIIYLDDSDDGIMEPAAKRRPAPEVPKESKSNVEMVLVPTDNSKNGDDDEVMILEERPSKENEPTTFVTEQQEVGVLEVSEKERNSSPMEADVSEHFEDSEIPDEIDQISVVAPQEPIEPDDDIVIEINGGEITPKNVSPENTEPQESIIENGEEMDENDLVITGTHQGVQREIKQEREQTSPIQPYYPVSMADYTAGWSMPQFFQSLRGTIADSNQILVKELMGDGGNEKADQDSTVPKVYQHGMVDVKTCVKELRDAVHRMNVQPLEGVLLEMNSLLHTVHNETVPIDRLRLALEAALAIMSS